MSVSIVELKLGLLFFWVWVSCKPSTKEKKQEKKKPTFPLSVEHSLTTLSAGIALIVRIPYIKKIAISADFLFETIDFAIWSVVEPSLGIMAGCIASIRPLFKTWGFGLNRSRRSASRQFQGSDEAGVVQRWRASRKVERLPESGSTGIGAGPDPVQRQPKGSQVLHVSDLELNPVETSSEHLTADRPNASALGSVGYGRKINEGDLAHGRGINVHTSINVVSSWRQDPPRQPRRVYRP